MTVKTRVIQVYRNSAAAEGLPGEQYEGLIAAAYKGAAAPRLLLKRRT